MNFRRGGDGDPWRDIRDNALLGAVVGGMAVVAVAGAFRAITGPAPQVAPVLTYTLSDGTRCAVPREGAGISCDWRKP